MIRDPWLRALVVLGVVLGRLAILFVVWSIASTFSDIVSLFFLAWVLAFIIEPTVTPLVTRVGRPRPVAITIAYVGLLALIVLGILFVTPQLIAQGVQLVTYLPGLAERVNQELLVLQSELESRGVTVNLQAVLGPEDLARRAEAVVPLILSNLVGIATGVAHVLFQATLLVIISFYLALDGKRFAEMFV